MSVVIGKGGEQIAAMCVCVCLYVCVCMSVVIGKGGEQIAAIQSESECKIQFAPGTGRYTTFSLTHRRLLNIMLS